MTGKDRNNYLTVSDIHLASVGFYVDLFLHRLHVTIVLQASGIRLQEDNYIALSPVASCLSP
jgi:hypothetical protein